MILRKKVKIPTYYFTVTQIDVDKTVEIETQRNSNTVIFAIFFIRLDFAQASKLRAKSCRGNGTSLAGGLSVKMMGRIVVVVKM